MNAASVKLFPRASGREVCERSEQLGGPRFCHEAKWVSAVNKANWGEGESIKHGRISRSPKGSHPVFLAALATRPLHTRRERARNWAQSIIDPRQLIYRTLKYFASGW